jgi:aspartate kinase
MGTHTVEKIGGTSISQFDIILDNVFLGPRKGNEIYNRIFVVSAYGGITDLLLENKKTGDPGVFQGFSLDDPGWKSALNGVASEMRKKNASLAGLGLDVRAADEFVDDRLEGIRSCLINVRQLCSYGHFQLPEYLPMVREMLSAVGEAHSAYNTAEILKSRGINALFVDLSGWKEEENLPFDDKIRSVFQDIDITSELPIATGYTKCAEGIMTTYDRGYSEITFSKIATITGAREGIIHKEYHLSTGDPKLVGEENVRVVGHTNYDVADQLADLGMEAIHPKASKSMERNNIPIRVRNAFEPDHPGTLISSNSFKSTAPRIEMITGRKNMMGIEIHDPDMVGESGYDLRVLSILKKHGISYVTKNTNANTITHYVPRSTQNLKKCVSDLHETFPSAEIREIDVALVCAIGSNMKVPGFLAKAANALADARINILALDQCMRQVNMQFIVDESDFDAAIRALHKGLVEI